MRANIDIDDQLIAETVVRQRASSDPSAQAPPSWLAVLNAAALTGAAMSRSIM